MTQDTQSIDLSYLSRALSSPPQSRLFSQRCIIERAATAYLELQTSEPTTLKEGFMRGAKKTKGVKPSGPPPGPKNPSAGTVGNARDQLATQSGPAKHSTLETEFHRCNVENTKTG